MTYRVAGLTACLLWLAIAAPQPVAANEVLANEGLVNEGLVNEGLVNEGLATEVFVSRGEFGEPSFSDVASPGAAPVQLDVPNVSAAQRLGVEAQTQQTLAVAEELAAARLQRQRERAERQAEAEREVIAPVVYQRPPDYGVARWPAAWYGRGWHPPHRFARPGRFGKPVPPPAGPPQPRQIPQRWIAPGQR